MATCIPTPTLTLFTTVISTTVVTTFSASVQTLPDTSSTFTTSSCLSTVSAVCVSLSVFTGTTVIPGGVSTVSIPLIITSIITEVDPTSTLFASCLPNPSNTSPPSQPTSSPPLVHSSSHSFSLPSFSPTTFLVTTTPSPTVVTEQESSTLGNGVITVVTVTSTSTPPPSVVLVSTSVVAASQSLASPSQASRSSSVLAPIVGGAVGGFFFLISVVAVVWIILRKCYRPKESGEEEMVFPYPVTRDRDHTRRRLDLTHEPKPYMYGFVGRSTPDAVATTSWNSPPLTSHSRTSDRRPDSATALIGVSSEFTSIGLASSVVALPSSVYGAQAKGFEVGRQASHSSASQLPPGAAPPLDYSSHPGEDSRPVTAPGPSRHPLQVVNPPLSPVSIQSSFPPGAVSSSSSVKPPLATSELEKQSARPEKNFSSDLSSSSGDIIVHTDGLQAHGHKLPSSDPRNKLPAQPEVIPSDAPPAYVA